jgi:teichoic acid glycerol-phosphate primase
MSLSCAAVNFGLDERLLDHLAPFTALLDMPLYVTDEKNFDLLHRYYPFVRAIFYPPAEIHPNLFEEYDCLFQSTFWRPEEKAFFSLGRKKKLFFAYLPHGNSDKGHHAPMMKWIGMQDLVLIYGKQMVERLQKQGFWKDVKKWAFLGNYREAFYRQHQAFYDETVQREIFSSLDRTKKICLYAPTWQDPEKSSSFFSSTKKLVKQVPSNLILLIKPHPLLEEKDPARYQELIGLCERSQGVKIVEKMPLIYPLLEKVDFYLGDFSSIGYDFLTFQKPMFFLPPKKKRKQDPSLFLRKCGIEIPEKEEIFSFIDQHLSLFDGELKKKQKEMELFAFGEKRTFSQIKESFFCSFKELFNSSKYEL